MVARNQKAMGWGGKKDSIGESWNNFLLVYRNNGEIVLLLINFNIFSFYFLELNHGKGNGTPLQYSCLENPKDGGAWWAAVHVVAKSRTRLSDFTSTFMHWRRKWQPAPMFLPGESQRQGSLVGCRLWDHRVGHNWSDLAAAAAAEWILSLKDLGVFS